LTKVTVQKFYATLYFGGITIWPLHCLRFIKVIQLNRQIKNT